jgi:hypothetical protein
MFGPYANTGMAMARLSDIQPRGGLPGPGITAGLGPVMDTGHDFVMGDKGPATHRKPSGPPPGQNPPVPNKPCCSMKGLVLGLAGASVVGMLMTGAPLMDVATSLDGALGATLGFAAGSYASDSQYVPLIAAIAVPALIGGQLDAAVAGMGAAAYYTPQFGK